ncbi:MAG: hypothetical protein QUS33_01465 [Dehalococcoidia bacterium]|nr:hypothetical protein [Dehalococcoidia bacterium]
MPRRKAGGNSNTLLNACPLRGIVTAAMKKVLFLLTALGLLALVYLVDLLAFQYLGLDRHISGWWRITTDVCFALVVILLCSYWSRQR